MISRFKRSNRRGSRVRDKYRKTDSVVIDVSRREREDRYIVEENNETTTRKSFLFFQGVSDRVELDGSAASAAAAIL